MVVQIIILIIFYEAYKKFLKCILRLSHDVKSMYKNSLEKLNCLAPLNAVGVIQTRGFFCGTYNVLKFLLHLYKFYREIYKSE